MKHISIKSVLLGASIATALCACDENSWNDEYLEGFEKPTISITETAEYTMTASDVAKLANLSANKTLARERGESELLARVGQQGYFTADLTPEAYAPAWLDSLSAIKGSPVYYLSEKSTLKLSYPTSDALPAELTGIQNAAKVTISEAQYQQVWNSETDFVEAFSPSKPASKFIPDLLSASINAGDNHFAVVTYNVASQDPMFGGNGGGQEPPTPSFEQSSVIGTAKIGEHYTVNGIVTAICKQGYIITDATGSLLVYYGSSFDASSYAIGQQRTVDGTCATFGGCLQISGEFTDELVGTTTYEYPTPLSIDGATFEQFSTDRQALKADNNGGLAIYAEIKGATFTKSGNYINFTVPGADKTKAEGSGYQLTQDIIDLLVLDGGTCDVRGYVIGCSGKAYVTFLVTEVDGKAPAAAPAMTAAVGSRAGVAINSKEEKAVYNFTESGWKLCPDVLVLTSDDYSSMGVRNNLSATQAATYLPIYLDTHFPYAQDGAEYYVVYNLYNGSETVTNFCSRATYDGAEWSFSTINTDMMQFVRADKGNGWSNWMYDPSIYIDLPAGKGATSAQFWQACVDWVYENVDVPEFGSESITSGVGYVTSYGNNDYYTGASAYQCNVDLRAASARKQVPSVYGSMSDEAVVAQMKDNFENKVMPAILAAQYPDAQPGKGVDQYYVISFVMYNGSSHDEVIRYLVTAPGTFEFVDCTWNE